MTDPEIPRCTAVSSQTGERCKQRPIRGGTVCQTHGGSAPQVRQAAQERLLEARVRGELKRRGWEPVTDPLAGYADLAGEVVAFKDLAREQVNELEDWALTIGALERDDSGTGEREFMAMAEQAKAVVGVYERALDRAEKILVGMLRLGLDAAALRVSRERPTKEQAELLASALRALVSDPRVTIEGDASVVVLDALKVLEVER